MTSVSPQPGTSASRKRRRRHIAYAVVVSIVVVLAGYLDALPVFRSHLMQYLEIGDARFGLLFGIGSLTGLVSVFCGGQLLDRWGPRRLIRICVAGLGSGMLIMAFCGQSFPAFALAVGWSAIFAAPLGISVSAYLSKLFPRHRRRVVSIGLASASIGFMLAPIGAEGLLLLADRSPTISFGNVLHMPFLILGVMLVGANLIYRKQAVANFNATPPSEAYQRRWHWRDLLLPPEAFLLTIMLAMHGVADNVLGVWMARFLESRSFPGELIAPGFVLAAVSLAYFLARITLAFIPDRVGRRAFIVLPGVIGGSLLIAGLLSRSYLFTVGGYILGGFCWCTEYPAMVSSLLDNHRKRFGVIMAVSGLICGLSLFLAQNAMGMLVDRLGDDQMWKLMLLPACVYPLISLCGLIWLLRYDRYRQSNSREP